MRSPHEALREAKAEVEALANTLPSVNSHKVRVLLRYLQVLEEQHANCSAALAGYLMRDGKDIDVSNGHQVILGDDGTAFAVGRNTWLGTPIDEID